MLRREAEHLNFKYDQHIKCKKDALISWKPGQVPYIFVIRVRHNLIN